MAIGPKIPYAGTWELVNMFLGTKNFSYHICYENSSKTAKNSRLKRQIKLNNVLVKKSLLNGINKEGPFIQGCKDRRKIKRKVSQNLADLQNLLINLAS